MRASITRGAAVAVSLVLLGAVPAVAQATSATAATTPVTTTVAMRWKLALDFRTHPNRNPFPSYLGGPAVWSLRESRSLARNGNYGLLPAFSPSFGSTGIKAWHGATRSCVSLPAIGVNVTNGTLPLCTGHVPSESAFARPDATHMAVVAWTSPFDGTASISHDSIADIDGACGDGVTYYVDFGTTQLNTARLQNNGVKTLTTNTLSIHKGQSLFFIVDAGPSGNFGCDTTQLQVTIDQLKTVASTK